jgi:hypothetical protein
VLKIRLSERVLEDYVAWHYEKAGIFSVRSAYHLAVQIDKDSHNQATCSAKLEGSQPGFKDIWSAAAPTKVCVCLATCAGSIGNSNQSQEADTRA